MSAFGHTTSAGQSSTISLDDAYRHCEGITRASGSSFLATFWMFPPPQRRALHAIYAFCRLADDMADDPSIAGNRRRLLAAWRRELDLAYQGRSHHPVGVALADSARRYRLNKRYLDDLLDGIEWDLDGTPFETFSSLESYCYRVASTVGLLVLSVRGIDPAEATEYATSLGLAVQLTNILRDVGDDAREGRCYLAREDLERLGVKESDLIASEASEPLRLLLACYAERARIRFERADKALRPEWIRSARPAQAMGAVYRTQLERLCTEGFPCLGEARRLSSVEKFVAATRGFIGAHTA